MTRSLTAAMRRGSRLMRPRKQAKSTRSMKKAVTGFMIASAFAPLEAMMPRATKSSKSAKSPKPAKSSKSVKSPRSRKIPVPRIPQGAQYLDRRHRSRAGSRGYKLYLPASHPKRPKGLILMLHGCSQTPDDFAVGTHMNALAEKQGLAVAYPAQNRGHNAGSCWNWFRPAHQTHGAGEPGILASLTQELMREFGLGRDSVFVAGLSAGGAMAVILADLYPDIYSAAGIHSGLARGSARDMISAMSVMRRGAASEGGVPTVTASSLPVRRIIFQGAADSTVHPSNAAMIIAAAVGGDAVPTRIGKRSVSGRGYARSDYAGSDGSTLIESWMIEGAGHAWSGGRTAGSFTDRQGPDASAHMIRFFTTKST